MSFGWGVGDILAISGLAVKVYTAYKDAPDNYKHISDEVKSLQIIIDNAARHFKSTTLNSDNLQKGQEVLKGCENVLEDLNSLIEEYNNLSSPNKGQVLKRIKLGGEDIATLRVRLISNTGLLSSFIQRFDIPSIIILYVMLIPLLYSSCEFLEMQAQLNSLLGLHRTNSTVSINSVTSFAGSTKTRNAFKRFCQNLYEIGVRADMIKEKESEILNIFNPQNPAVSDNSNITHSGEPHNSAVGGQVDDNNLSIMDQSQFPAVSNFLV